MEGHPESADRNNDDPSCYLPFSPAPLLVLQTLLRSRLYADKCACVPSSCISRDNHLLVGNREIAIDISRGSAGVPVLHPPG